MTQQQLFESSKTTTTVKFPVKLRAKPKRRVAKSRRSQRCHYIVLTCPHCDRAWTTPYRVRHTWKAIKKVLTDIWQMKIFFGVNNASIFLTQQNLQRKLKGNNSVDTISTTNT